MFKAGDIDGVVVCTRHDSHAHFTVLALENGKHVFVEKPLCLSQEELKGLGLPIINQELKIMKINFDGRI